MTLNLARRDVTLTLEGRVRFAGAFALHPDQLSGDARSSVTCGGCDHVTWGRVVVVGFVVRDFRCHPAAASASASAFRAEQR